MKRLSEVCEMLGITRRKLQEYDRIDLVKPSSKTKSGYWLYDDDAIDTIKIAIVLSEVGYNRKQIKEIIENSDIDIDKLFDSIIKKLEDKQKRIKGMVNTIKLYKSISEFPQSTIDTLMSNIDSALDFPDFSDLLQSTIGTLGDYDYDDMKDRVFIQYLGSLTSIGLLSNESKDSEIVQTAVSNSYKYLYLMGALRDGTNDVSFENDKYKYIDIFPSITSLILSKYENELCIKESSEFLIGSDSIKFIIEAVEFFCKRINDTEKSKKEMIDDGIIG